MIRWRETVWKPKRRKTSKPVKIGERLITAEVVKCGADGWIQLAVKGCDTLRAEGWWKDIPPLARELWCRRGPIGKGSAERLAWSDESARALVASRVV